MWYILLCWKWFHPPRSLCYSTFWSRLGWSPRKYEAIPRTERLSKHYEHMHHGLLRVFFCKCASERRRENCVGKRERNGRKEGERQRGRWRSDIKKRQGESERKSMCVYILARFHLFSSGDSCGHTLSTLALGRPPKHTHTHTYTTIKTLEWPTYSFTGHVCSLSVMSP